MVKATPPHPATVAQRRNEPSPHPATVVKAIPPHPATVAQRRNGPNPHPATVVAERPPHAATVAQRREAPFGAPRALPPHAATVNGPAHVPPHPATTSSIAQPMYVDPSGAKKSKRLREQKGAEQQEEFDNPAPVTGTRRRKQTYDPAYATPDSLGYPGEVAINDDALEAKYGRATLPALDSGLPGLPYVDFSVAQVGDNSVTIQYQGSRAKDYDVAEAELKVTHTAGVTVWHHVADFKAATATGTLQLVHYDLHSHVKHAGGVEQAKPSFGGHYP